MKSYKIIKNNIKAYKIMKLYKIINYRIIC